MKNSFRKIVTLLLVCAAALCLTACGSAPEKTAGGSAAPAAPQAEKQEAADAATVPEYIYSAEFKNIFSGTKTSLTPRYFTDSGVYAIGEEIVGRRAPEDVEEEYFGQYDIREPRISFITYSGEAEELTGYRPLSAPEAPEGSYNYDFTNVISGLTCIDGGKLLVIETAYLIWDDAEDLSMDSEEYYDHHFYEERSYIRVLDETGAELHCAEVPTEPNEFLYSDGTLDRNGNILFRRTTEYGETFLTAVNTDGETVYEIAFEDSVNNFFVMEDGSVYANVWGNGIEMVPVDTEAKTLGEGKPLPSDAYYIYAGGGDYPLYYTSGASFYGFDPASGESTKLFNWIDCDVDPTYLSAVGVSPDGTIYTIVFDFDNYSLSYNVDLAAISKKPYDPATEKKELTLATQALSLETRTEIIRFNRKHPDCRIAVKDYSEYNTEEDYSAGLTKLTTEIMAGNCPDIIDLNGLSKAQLAAKGLIEDLYPFLDADGEINRDYFLPTVLKAAEVNGKLVSTLSYFTVNTVIGPSSVVGDEPGWTYDDLKNALLDMPEGCEAFEATVTRDQILTLCLNLGMDDYVNRVTGELHFDTDEFIAMLKFANSFPESYDWATYDSRADDVMTRISEGRQLLYRTSFDSFDSLMYIESCYHGTPVTFIGYPTLSGTGNTIEPDTGFAIASSCEDKDIAWEFLRGLMTERYYENNIYYGLPAQKELFEKKLQKICTLSYQVDASGSYKLDAKGEKIPAEHLYVVNSNIYSYYALSEEIAAQFKELVDTTTKAVTRDDSINAIVLEQSAAYFAGQKTAEEAAKLVQSKASIYVNEQR